MDAELIPLIKQRLRQPLPGRTVQFKMAPSFRPDIDSNKMALTAGVMLLLYPNPVELYIVFMQRATYPGVHSAQVSFPGGKYDHLDKDLTYTALRETNEEIGIKPVDIEILGSLTPLYIPISEIEVFPTVGFLSRKSAFSIDTKEVEYLIEEPVKNFLNLAIKKIKPYSGEKYMGDIPYFDVQGSHIWGASAMILNEFIEILKEIVMAI